MILSGRTEARTGWVAGVLLLLVATAVLPLAAVVRADPKDAAAPLAEPIKTELKLKNTRFRADAPIMVDVWLENQTEQDIERKQFSPISSSVGVPDFVIVRVPDGKEFSIPPGLFGDDWDQWYQPVSGKRAFSVGGFSLPSGKRIHLLHGDLRLTVVRAREHCQRALDEDSTLKRPDNASTKKHYQEIVRSADDFLSGGTFDIRVRAYSRSQTIRIAVDKKDSLGASDDLHVMLFLGVPDTKRYKGTGRHLMTLPVELDTHFSGALRDGYPKLDGIITTKDKKLHARVNANLGTNTGEYVGLIEEDAPFAPSGGSVSAINVVFYFIVTKDPMSHLKKKRDHGR